ncbi:hypothetical protein AALP_AA3G036500 [Arabis alpina]|uniref:Ionotropic glutamate receptor C-terminal domain-containing protein n=1 Tax=Arabis alpina TaxID=50452 RepID=A0A087H6U4_ARAAL|nr:hypothetical protein AALP_AA3G036500 [Arabis alpina]
MIMETLASLIILILVLFTTDAAKVGLVLDLSSIQGKILETSFSLALSDFYNVNNGYRNRVSVLVRDSQGDPLLGLASAIDLLKTSQVEVIIGTQSLHEAKLLSAICEKAVMSVLVPNSLSLNKDSTLEATFTNFTSRLRKLMVDDDENFLMETKHYSSVLWAHDIAYILATAVEKMKLSTSANVSNLLETIRQSSFKGLSHGNIQILLETFEIVNIVGDKCDSFNKRRHIWPRGSGKIPPRQRFLAEHEVFKTCIAPFNYELEFIPYRGNNDNLAYLLSTQRDKYDAAVGDITITSNRSSYVDFTLPYTDIGIGILTVKKKSQGMWTFFDPFEKSLWLASGAFFILTGIVVWLVEKPVNPEFQGSWGQQLSMMLWFGFSTIVFAHREKLQKMSSRFLVIVWIFVVLILTSSYSANLTSTKTISRIQLNHQSVLVFPTKSMKLGSINAVEAYNQGLRDGTLSHVINEIPYLNLLVGYYPDVFVMTDRETNTNGFGFMFQRGSGLAPIVSREIAKLRSLGILKDMEKRWFQKLDSLNVHANIEDGASLSEENDDASNRFSFRELRGLFIIAGAAHALVLALHLVHMRREIFTKLQKFYK